MMEHKIYPLGENALTIDLGNEISIEKNDLVINLAGEIERNNFEGFIECVPAYSSLTILFDVFEVRKTHSTFPTAFEFVKTFATSKLENLSKTRFKKSKTIEIPVSFVNEFALDLDFVAKTNSLVPKEVIEIFISKTYKVFMLGFLPGFAYMGELDEKIATPRKQTPRTRVPTGSVGIAGQQTGIYPLESPGGWQIIGRTDVELFNPNNKQLTLFEAGDLVKFIETK